MAEVDITRPDVTVRYPRGPWTLAAAAAGGCVLVALVDPTRHQLSPLCPFKALTGWWCPFCGATRAASRLLRGDLTTAFHFNAAFVVLLPLGALMWVAAAFPTRWPALDPLRRASGTIMKVAALLLVAFVVARNTGVGDAWLRYPGD